MVKAKRSLSGIQRVYEAGLILVIFCAVIVMFALCSFAPSDPSWSQTAWQGPVKNAIGPTGAWISDLLLFLFGYFAYFIPVAMVLIGWTMFWHPRPKYEVDYVRAGMKIIGLLLTLVGITGLASINLDDFYFFSSGGLIGDLTVKGLIPVFGLLGTTLILLFSFAAGFTLFTGVSWLYVVDLMGSYSIKLAWILGRIPHKYEQYQLRKSLNRKDELDPLFATAAMDTTDFSVDEKPVESDDKSTQYSEAFAVSEALSGPIEPTFGEMPNSAAKEHEFTEVSFSALDTDEITPYQAPDVSAESEEENSWKPALHPEEEWEAYSEFSESQEFEPSIDPVFLAQQQLDAPGTDDAESLDVSGSDDAGELLPLTPLPSFDLLDRPNRSQEPISAEELEGLSRLVELKLLDFNIQANVVAVYPGPVVTRFELELAPGMKVARISALNKDLARSLSAISVRVVEVIPGKSVIGLEIPNKHREIVYLSEVLASTEFDKAKSSLSMVLGKDIAGKPVVVDLAKMPHLLVAGTTGSGKSVGVNVMILSLLYKSTPEQVRLIMIDPKMLELSVYEGIPHLLAEVVTDMKEAANALRWCVGEMERRYKLMSAVGVRNLAGFNEKVKQAIESGHPIRDPLWQRGDSMDEEAPFLEPLASIVVIVDEFADMMMIVGKKVEELIARIAQKARAAGIHLILATQRPSVDVITGLIKANIPTRIAFQVSSKIDSRTILDQQGAESLLGQGDMLYLPPGTGVPTRVHGAFVDDDEVHRVVADWKRRGKPNYIPEILEGEVNSENLLPGEQADGAGDDDLDPLYDEAVAFVTETRRGSVSGVQRKFKIGYNRAARIVEQMEMQGVVSSPGHNGNRDVLAPPPVRESY